MSLKPGIGALWFEKWHRDVYPHDFVVVNAQQVRPPKFYDRKLKTAFPDEYDDVLFRRDQDARLRFEDNTDARLAVKEQVTTARAKFLKRHADA